MTVRTRTRPEGAGRYVAHREPPLREVVVPAETVALIARRNARQIERLVAEVGAWLALVGFSLACLLVAAVAVGFV